jgi:hypothetical protein
MAAMSSSVMVAEADRSSPLLVSLLAIYRPSEEPTVVRKAEKATLANTTAAAMP